MQVYVSFPVSGGIALYWLQQIIIKNPAGYLVWFEAADQTSAAHVLINWLLCKHRKLLYAASGPCSV